MPLLADAPPGPHSPVPPGRTSRGSLVGRGRRALPVLLAGTAAVVPALGTPGRVDLPPAVAGSPVLGTACAEDTRGCGDGLCEPHLGEEDTCPADCAPLPWEPFGEALQRAFDRQAVAAPPAADPEGIRDRLADSMGLGSWPVARPSREVLVQASAPVQGGGYTEEEFVLDDPGTGRWGVRLLLPDPRPDEPLPAVIGLHGHGTTSASIRDEYGGADLARGGLVVALPDFPSLVDDLHAEMGPAEDLLAAGRSLMGLRWLQVMQVADLLAAHPSVDRTRLGVWGHSAGAILSVLDAVLDTRVKAVVTDWDPLAVRTRDNLLVSQGSADNYLPGLSGAGEWGPLVDSVALRVPVLTQDYDYPQGPAAAVAFLHDALTRTPVRGDGLCGPGEDVLDGTPDCPPAVWAAASSRFLAADPGSRRSPDPEIDGDAAALLASDDGHGDPGLARPRLLDPARARVSVGAGSFSRWGCVRAGGPVKSGVGPSWILSTVDGAGALLRLRITLPEGQGAAPLPVVLLLQPQPALPPRGAFWAPPQRGTPSPERVAALVSAGLGVVEPLLPGTDPTDPAAAPFLPFKTLVVGTCLPALWTAELQAVLDALPGGPGGLDSRRTVVLARQGWPAVGTLLAAADPRVVALGVDTPFPPHLSRPGWHPALRLPGAALLGDAAAWTRRARVPVEPFPQLDRQDGPPGPMVLWVQKVLGAGSP